jgi:ApaG protein
VYRCVTNLIEITVEPTFLEDESSPYSGKYLWSYEINIANLSSQTAQLISRRWEICNAYGHWHYVQGEGVVGEQPTLGPGERYIYTSYVPLDTPSGVMLGRFYVRLDHQDPIPVAIPTFSLDSPHSTPTLN